MANSSVSGGWSSCCRNISRAVVSTTAQPERSSAPSPVAGLPLFTTLPLTTGLVPSQTGTVSMCAISKRRGPGTVPGSLTMRLPQLPFSGVLVCDLSNEITLAGHPAASSLLRIASATWFSWPEIPGIASRSSTV